VTHPLHDRTLALAGLFQAARLTQQLAREGRAESEALAASVNSLFMLNAATTAEVFGGAGGVAAGLKFLRDKLTGATGPGDMEVARYVVAILHLERQLEKRPEVQDAIRRGIEAADDSRDGGGRAASGTAAESQAKSFAAEAGDEPLPPRTIEKLAELYTQTISTLGPRILVDGEQGYLANSLIAAKVRGVLFAGIRAAFLWRQLGGRRWQLLFQRRAIANAAGEILRGKSE
jgi:high frequency lysogenization protein